MVHTYVLVDLPPKTTKRLTDEKKGEPQEATRKGKEERRRGEEELATPIACWPP